MRLLNADFIVGGCLVSAALLMIFYFKTYDAGFAGLIAGLGIGGTGVARGLGK
jgi:hypothetical protein